MASSSSSTEQQSTKGIRYQCRLCAVSRSKRSLMLSHMQKSHPQALSEFSTVGKDQRIYKCSKCGATRSSIAKLHKHMQDDHSGTLNCTSRMSEAMPEAASSCSSCSSEEDRREPSRCLQKDSSQRSETASSCSEERSETSKCLQNDNSQRPETASSCSSSLTEEDRRETSRRYCCRLCAASRTKRSLILSHMQKNHPSSMSDFYVVGKDQRSYTCVACGVSRSTISMLRKHMQDSPPCNLQSPESPVSDEKLLSVSGIRKRKRLECKECGWLARKPSLLQQHLHSHSSERPYLCPEEGCGKCFKLPYHLNRHILRHEEKGCLCPRAGCISVCSNRSNLRRHLQMHDLKSDLEKGAEDAMKVFLCPEPGCTVVFRYPCRLQSHCDTVHGLPYADIRCCEPNCGKGFSNARDLLDHIKASHGTIACQICGAAVSRKSFGRHLMKHETSKVKQKLFCPFDGCVHSFTNASNLSVHVRVCHFDKRDFICTFDGCNRAFGYRHVRDNHEKSGFHTYVQGDFEVEDLKFQAGCRGGRKSSTLLKVEDLFRKRVCCPEAGLNCSKEDA